MPAADRERPESGQCLARPAGGSVRSASIDLLKACSIVAVIWIHAFQQRFWEEAVAFQRLAFVTRFAVPGFFFASGFLYARGGPLPARQFVTRRLVRLLVPYGVASMLAIGFRHVVLSEPVTALQVLKDLVGGGAFDIYYFVPILVGAAILGQGLFRFRWLAWPVFVPLWVLGLVSEIALMGIAGNPLRWWGYFFAGWVVLPYTASLRQLSPVRRRLLGTAALTTAALTVACYLLILPPYWSRDLAVLSYVYIYAVISGLFILALDAPTVPSIRWLSDATYPIYLYHIFGVSLAYHWLVPPLRGPVALALGCGVAAAVVCAGRRLLGPRARVVIG
jgi:surface polysaccharide O-acyltransferase-like enzyme